MQSFFKNLGRNIIERANHEFQDSKAKSVESVYQNQVTSIFSKQITNVKPEKAEVVTVAFESIWQFDGEKNDAKDEEVEGATTMKLLDASGHLLKGTSINSFAIGKSSEIDASRGELLSDIRDYEGRDAGETLARIASP